MTDPCVVCSQNTEIKAKPGIFPCLGCKQTFCTKHVAVHRQELTNELDIVIGERNELQDLFDHQKGLPSTTFHMDLIDKWIKKTIEQVYQVADKAHQSLISIAEQQRPIIENELAELTKQLNDTRENENFFEQDIAHMKNKCSRLKAAINQVNTKMNTDDVCHSLDAAITFQETEQAEQATTELLSSVESILKHEKPYKQIQLPHDGALCVVDKFVLIKNQTDYTMVRFQDNSMRSISFGNLDEYVYCWSAHHKTYFCMNCEDPRKIRFLPVLGRKHKKTITIADGEDPINIACFMDNLLIVRSNFKSHTIIEEWCLSEIDYETWAEDPPSVKLVSRWNPPLSCSMGESIQNITFNTQHIVLAINNSQMSPKNRLEFRTRGMLVLGRICLDENIDFLSMSLLPIKDGWILGWKKIQNQTRQYIFIDKNFHEHEQKILSTQNIENITILDKSSDEQSLAIYRKRNDVQTTTVGNQQFVLSFYKMQKKK